MQASTLVMEDGPFSVIIVDSITAPYRSGSLKPNEVEAMVKARNRSLTVLMQIAKQFGIAVVVTSQVIADLGPHTDYNSRRRC